MIKFLFAYNDKWWALGSRILRWAEGTEFSHCAIEIDGMVYESVWPRSKKTSIEIWETRYKIRHAIVLPVSDEKLVSVKQEVEGMMGVKYSIVQLIAIGIGMLGSFFDSKVSNVHWNGSKFLICTEFVALVLANQFDLEFDEKLDTISLSESFKAVRKLAGG